MGTYSPLPLAILYRNPFNILNIFSVYFLYFFLCNETWGENISLLYMEIYVLTGEKSQPPSSQDTNFYSNKGRLWTLMHKNV